MAIKPRVLPELALGDRVRIKNYSGPTARIVELRGPLGPNGVNVYRVAIPQKPGFSLVELQDSQLERLGSPARRFAGGMPSEVRNAIKQVKRRLGSLG